MKKKIFVLSAALLGLGLASCTAQAPEEDSSEPSSSSIAPSSESSASSTSEASSSSTPSSTYDWNVIDERTTLKVLAWDRYCEVNDANADEKATDDAGCEGKGTAHVDALISAYIATLPADTAVRIGVYHTTTYANDPVAALANDYDLVLGAGAKISANYGATNRVAIADMTAESNAYLATASGRKVALMSENAGAIAMYNYLTGSSYGEEVTSSESSSQASSEASSESSTEVSSEASSETASTPEITQHDFVVAWYNKPTTSGCSENVVAKFQAALTAYIQSIDPTKTDIVFKGYEGNAAPSCAAIAEDVKAGTLLPNIMVGWKANLSFPADSGLTYNTISNEEGTPIAFTVGEEGGTVKTDRYLITLQLNGAPVSDLTNSVVTWMQTEEGRASTYIGAAA